MQALVLPVVNRVLRRNAWALDELRACAGRTARFDLPLVSLRFTVLESGELGAAASDAPPGVTFTLTPGVALRLLARDESVWRDIPVSGDTDFATVLNQIWRNVRWDIEEDLAKIFGDVAAHRMAAGARTLDQWRARSMESVARGLAEYWTEEQPLIASAYALAQFNRDVDLLRDDAARLEKRIEQLTTRI
jgi:ubiquinone biosynthesis protein UbiJ